MNEKVHYLFFSPNDPYFLRIHATIIELLYKSNPESVFVISPVYGIRFDRQITGPIDALRDTKQRIKDLIQTFRTTHAILTRYFSKDISEDIKTHLIWISPQQWITTIFHSGFSSPSNYDDLLVDTYIRFKPSPTTDRNDMFWHANQKRANRYYILAKWILAKYPIKAAFGSYCSYIYHGVPHRVCLSEGINTVSFGAIQGFFKIHRQAELNPTHVGDYTDYNYPPKVMLPPELIEQAEASLKARIYGQRDISVPYMKENRSKRLEAINDKLKSERLILLHDFYDSSHIYRYNLFENHFEWTVSTIKHLMKTRQKVFIKPHPNATQASRDVIVKLKDIFSNYNEIYWIDSSVTNISLFEASPSLVLTVYGSVGPEAAYCGIPVLYAGDHPAINFPIGSNPTSLEEYYFLLDHPNHVNIGSKDAAISFMAQHYRSLFEARNQSLIGYLGCSWENLYKDPSILVTSDVSTFLESSCSELIYELSVK